MVPECSTLPPVFRLDHDYPRTEFETRIVPDQSEPWRITGHCKNCGQVWLIEQHDAQSRSHDFAIKIPDPLTWTAGHERAARIEYLRRSRGGDAEVGECIVAGCRRPPLNGLVYCAEHAFDRTGARE
jgi:hypothetical protein